MVGALRGILYQRAQRNAASPLGPRSGRNHHLFIHWRHAASLIYPFTQQLSQKQPCQQYSTLSQSHLLSLQQ